MDIEKIAKAIEADAGQPLTELRDALREAQGRHGHITDSLAMPGIEDIEPDVPAFSDLGCAVDLP